MKKLKKGDIVARISYNKDVLFEITKIIKTNENKRIMILKGITERIEADSPEEDLELVDKRIVTETMKNEEDKISIRIRKYVTELKRSIRQIETGKILHLDGDRRYSEKSSKYYKNLNLNAIVKNIPENKQAQIVGELLNRYNPDILVITRP